MISRIGLLFALVALLLACVHAQKIVQVIDASDFCTMMPPPDSKDRSISGTEGYGEAFCTGNTTGAVGAHPMPSGFIRSVHFASGSGYVQVTGTINPAAANLDPNDEGGQYDINAPDGASCAGYRYFVNVIEPDDGIFCIRCCNDQKHCNRGISEAGCRVIVPGDYSGPLQRRAPAADEGAATLNRPVWAVLGSILTFGAVVAAV